MNTLGNRSFSLRSLAFPLFVAIVVGAGVLLWNPLIKIFQNPGKARAWVDSTGSIAPLVFVGLQILQVVIFIIPGEIIQIGGGYVSGFWGAALLSFLGILAGSLINFLVGRLLGRPFVERIVSKESLTRIEKSTSSGKAAAGFFLLFVIPGIPKDVLCYAAGMSRIGPLLFLALSGLGRLPGILGSAYVGNSAYKQEYGSTITVLAIASCLFFAGLIFKDQITEAIRRALHLGDHGPDDRTS